MTELLQYTITGIAVGMVYALIALGFALIWKSSSVANLALGQLVLISSWFTYGMLVQAKFPYWIGFPLTIIFAIFLGWLIERFTLRPLIAQPILALITVTLGIAYFLEGVVTFVWPMSVAALPRLFPQAPLHIGAAVVSQEYVWAAVISLILFGLLSLFFKYHKMGVAMRATADDQLAVQACAIPVTSVFSTSWIFACVVAAIGGVLIFEHRWYYFRSGGNRVEVVFSGDTWRSGFFRRLPRSWAHNRIVREPRRWLSHSIYRPRDQGYHTVHHHHHCYGCQTLRIVRRNPDREDIESGFTLRYP